MSAINHVNLIVILSSAVIIAGCGKPADGDHVEYTKPDGTKTSDIKTLGDGDVAYQVRGGKPIPAKAEQLHREARAKGEAGDYVSALALLKQASEIAPDWPYPYYDMAFTYLLQGDTKNALLNYREVDRLEPRGFFTAKTALWTLDREEKGVFPKGTYLDFVSLEWAKPEKKKEIITRMTTNTPTFAPAWKELAFVTESTDQRLALYDKALSLDPDPETYGICVMNKASLLNQSGKSAEAQRMMEDLIQSDASTITTKNLAKEMMKTFKK